VSGTGPVVLLGSDGPGTRIIYHALAREFDDVEVVLERRLSKPYIFWRRLRRIGAMRAFGQVPFRALVIPWLVRRSAARIAAIKAEYGFDDAPIRRVAARVRSVNTPEARAALQRLRPGVVAVSGTRIIGRDTLSSVPAPFINMHGGITPLYRGVHGGYWALVDGRPDLAGSTVHRVDTGIDTGPIIAQATFAITPDDSFATYPYLHLAVGIPILITALRDARAGRIAEGSPPALPSRLRTHPTVWEYAQLRLRRGIR
jgi:folate-dependent phosphoribosylglycinamide formyltransferase PurN